MKHPVKFCWECGRRLRGNHFALAMIDGYQRTLHKQCAMKLQWVEEWKSKIEHKHEG